jgi:hypothetical protein
MAGIDDVNRHPVIHTWSYKLEDAACYDSNQENAESSSSLCTRFVIHSPQKCRKEPLEGELNYCALTRLAAEGRAGCMIKVFLEGLKCE